MREKDESIPLRHGVIGQETCGPGGRATASQHHSDAGNHRPYGNLFAVLLDAELFQSSCDCGRSLLRPASEFKVLNICDMPVGTLRRMSQIIGKDPQDLEVRYFGLNHFGWWTSVKDKEGHEYL